MLYWNYTIHRAGYYACRCSSLKDIIDITYDVLRYPTESPQKNVSNRVKAKVHPCKCGCDISKLYLSFNFRVLLYRQAVVETSTYFVGYEREFHYWSTDCLGCKLKCDNWSFNLKLIKFYIVNASYVCLPTRKPHRQIDIETRLGNAQRWQKSSSKHSWKVSS